MVYSTDAQSIWEHRVNGPRRSKKGHKPLGPKSTLFLFFFFLHPNGILSLPPGLTRQPRAVYLSPFCIGQFPLFRGISKPILGLAWAATGDSPRHPHRRAFPHPPPHPFSSLLPSSVPLATPDNLHSRAPPCRPTPLSSGPPRKRKACGFSSRVGVGLFPSSPVTSSAPPDWPMPRQWRHIGLAHWPTRFIDISTVHPLSSPQKWVTRTGVARTGPFSLKLSLLLSLSLSLSFFLSLSFSLFLSRTVCIFLLRSLPGSIALCVEAWRFRRVPREISAAMFSYQKPSTTKKFTMHLQRRNGFSLYGRKRSSCFVYC